MKIEIEIKRSYPFLSWRTIHPDEKKNVEKLVEALHDSGQWLMALVAEISPGNNETAHDIVITITKAKSALSYHVDHINSYLRKSIYDR